MKTETQPRLHILLADDNKDDRYFFEKALKELPVAHQFATVPDGERLTDYLLKNRTTLPDVIFLDLGMPKKSGWECLAEIVTSKKWKDVPVVVYSATCNADIADMLYSGGAYGCLQKCELPQLVELLQYLLNAITHKSPRPGREDFVLQLHQVRLADDVV